MQQVSEKLRDGKFALLLHDLRDHQDSSLDRTLLAYCYSKLGNEQQALEILPELIQRSDFDNQVDFVVALLVSLEIKINSLQSFDIASFASTIKEEFSSLADDEYSRYLMAQFSFLTGLYYITQSDSMKSLEILEKISTNAFSFDPMFQGRIYHVMGYAHRNLSNFSRALEYYNRSLSIKKQYPNYIEIADTLNHIGITHGIQSNMTKAEGFFKEILLDAENDENSLAKAKALNNLGILAKAQGHLDTAFEYYKQSLAISKALKNAVNTRNCYLNMGNIKLEQSQYSEAIRHYQKALGIKDLLRGDETHASILLSLGLVHKRLGHFKRADYYYHETLKIATNLNDLRFSAKILNNLASISRNRGKIDQAILEFKEALNLTEQTSDLETQASVLANLGQCYAKLNDHNQAFSCLQNSLKIRRNLGNSLHIATTLFHLIQLELTHQNHKRAKKYLGEFGAIASHSDNREIISRYNIIRATVLQQSNNVSDQLQASELIEEVLSGEYVNFEVTTFAMISFCEYLLLELRQTNSLEILQELEDTVEKLYTLASDNESHELIAKTLIIQAKLALLRYETKEAIHYLHQAQSIGQSHNLEEINLQVSYIEIQVQSSLYEMGDRLSESTERFGDRIDELELMEYIKNLHYQREANEILRSDIQNIRRFNTDLADLIQYDGTTPLHLENLARIVELTSREINVIYQSLLLIEEMEKGLYELYVQPTKVSLMLDDLTSIYQSGFLSNDIEFHLIDIPHELSLAVDSNLFEKVIDHLLINMIKFTTKQGTASIRYIKSPAPQLIFQNDCIKIPHDVLVHLTTKYFQYSPEDSLVKGYGIGLTFVDLAASLMGLPLTIRSPADGREDGFELVLEL